MKSKEPGTIRQLFAFVGENNGKMLLSIFLAVLGELFGIGPFLMVAVLADALYRGTATPKLVLFLCGGAAVCQIIKMLLTWRSSLMSHKISFTILKNIREAITGRMAKIPMGVMLETPSGTFKTLMVDNVGRLEDIIAHMVPELPSNLAGPVFSIILVFVLDWRMGLAAFITVPLSLVFAVCMMRGYKEKMAVYLRSGNEMNAALVEYVGGIQVIKAFGQGSKSFGEFSRSVNFLHDSTLAWWRQSWFWMAGFKAVLPSTLLGTLPVGAWLYMQGTLELPLFLACIIIPFGFMAGLIKFGFALGQLSYMAPNLDPIQDFLATPEQRRPEKPVKLGERSFRFDRVCFSYDGKKEVLHDVNFTARTGQITAIVGPSGSGKSTIAKLIAGLVQPSQGKVSLFEEDISRTRKMALALRKRCQIVFQNPFGALNPRLTVEAALREPLELMNLESHAQERIREALQSVNLPEDFLARYPHELSGGQRQRVCIARGILSHPDLLICDEIVSALDPTVQVQVLLTLHRLQQERRFAMFFISHDLDVVEHISTKIAVVYRGSIVEYGPAEAVMNRPKHPYTQKLIQANRMASTRA